METLIFQKKDHKAYVTLNRPQQRNALNRQMTRELTQVWRDVRDDSDIWAVILAAQGQSFCAGADVKEMERGEWNLRQSLLFGDDQALPGSHGLYKPLIVAATGHVYGAGLLLFLEADLRVVGQGVKLGLPEGRVNVPFLAAPFVFDYIPRAVACEMILTGQPLSAERAFDLGLVNRVVPDQEILAQADELADRVLKVGPLANFAAKELYTRGHKLDRAAALALVEHVATPVWNAEDSREAKRAFQEKRPPRWQLK